MKTKGLETYLYSTLGVVAMLVIVVAFNLIAARAKARLDLTAERAYTLSPGTRNILAKLDTPVQIRFYCTRGDNRMPVFLKTYAQRVEDLLGEYRQLSKGQIEIQKLDPVPDSDAEDSAKLDGIEGQPLENGEPIYLGVSVSMLDQKEVVPFLTPSRERLLEYDLSRAISRVITPEKPVVGIMSPLPFAGQQMSPMMMQMGRRGGQPAWVFYSELQRDFNVKQVEMTAESIPDDVKVLLLIHPKAISDAAQFAIDQFVLRGGKLIAFLDPMAALDAQGGGPMGGGSSSSIDKLLKAWGLTFESTKVVADTSYTGRTQQGRAPAVLALTDKAVNKDDIITAEADNLFMAFAGAFTGAPVAGLKETVLIKSSKDSQLIEPMLAQMDGERIIRDFSPSGTEYALAVRLTGKFKTAFPEGKPKAEPKPDEPPKPDEKKPDAATDKNLKESAQENSVVLVGDSDMIQDQLCVREMPNPFGGGQRMVMPANGNLAFAQGAVEQLTGDNNLITVRSRASRERPFTVVRKMQADAESNYRSKIKELETSLTEAQTKLNDLQRAKAEKGGGQKFILSPEQQTEIANFRKKEGEVKQQLKVERKKLRVDIDSLENRIKWLNIAGMPALVALAGVGLAVVARKRRAAR
jgi:ABC-type uncharacterized transport system involved in gliding motility auxiliary subunit